MKKILIGFIVSLLGLVLLTGCVTNTDRKEPDDGEPLVEPVDDPVVDPDPNSGESGGQEEDPKGYEISFVLDSNVTIKVYKTQSDMTEDTDGEETLTAFSRDSETGELTQTDGQVNFVISFSEGYEIDNIEITGEYKNLKGSADTSITNGYRITKIASDLTVTITSKEVGLTENLDDGFKVEFKVPDGVSVVTYKTQELVEGEETLVAYSRDSATGALTQTDGQVNFLVYVPDGYEIDEITITGDYKNLKDLGDNYYRITKIASSLEVSITIKESASDPIDPIETDYVSELTIETTYEDNPLSLSITLEAGTFKYEFNDSVLVIELDSVTEEASYTLSGAFNGTIEFIATEEQDIEIALTGVTIYSTSLLPAIYVSSAHNCDISAKKNTENFIYDYREALEDLASAIYVVCDLKLKGTGALTVESTNNKGIHTKDDLTVQNLTLNVNVTDNALKGNDSVTINSGKLTLISRQGDGIKTSNSEKKYNEDGTLKKVQGTISLVNGEINIYAACDGIDASYNVEITGDVVLNIYTDKYSEYSEEVTATSTGTMYIRSTNANYQYSIYFYNDENDYVWKNSTTYTTVFGGKGTTYYYYEIEKPSGYANLIAYMYTKQQEQGQSTNYYVKSSNATINNNYDTLAYNTSRGTFSWTNYTTQPSGHGGPGGAGGPGGSGNKDKGDYSTKGLKADNEIIISGGTIFIKSYDDGIHTNTDVVLGDEDDLTDDYYGTGIITITGGTITIYSNDDGIHADTDLYIKESANITVTNSYEGVEANRIYIDGGTLKVYATDDAMNAAKCNGKNTPLIKITGGLVDLTVGSGDTDTMDSNGNIEISGGTVIVRNPQNNGTSMTGGTFDVDGTLKATGGIVISIGCWCNEASMSSNVSNTSTTLQKGNYVVKDSSGNEIVSFTLTQSYRGYRMYFSNKTGTYTLYCDGSSVLTIN